MIAVPAWNNDALNPSEDSNTTSSIVGGINIHTAKCSKRKIVQTSVKIPNGVYLGGDATLGGGILAAVDTWEAEEV